MNLPSSNGESTGKFAAPSTARGTKKPLGLQINIEDTEDIEEI
jgi:hypothetical protein